MYNIALKFIKGSPNFSPNRDMKHLLNIAILGLLLLCVGCSEPDHEANDVTKEETCSLNNWVNDFAQVERNEKISKDIVADYGALNDATGDASPILQQAIDEVSAAGGGEVYIPEGKYRFREIKLKSNVKLRVDHNAIIYPHYTSDNSKFTLFALGMEKNRDKSSKVIANVEISGVGGRFKIVLSKQTNAKAINVFGVRAVKNFILQNIHVEDVMTQQPIITLSPTEVTSMFEGEDIIAPTTGFINCISVNNCHYGYGVVQAQSAIDCRFEKLSGIGGVTLRFETGSVDMNDRQRGGLEKVSGKYIYCENGNASAMIAPHSMHNGEVIIENVESKSCGFAVRIDAGYVSDKQTVDGLTIGTFKSATVRDVVACYGVDAQVKKKHMYLLPAELYKPAYDALKNDAIVSPASSVAPILNDANYPVKIEGVDTKGYITEDIVGSSTFTLKSF